MSKGGIRGADPRGGFARWSVSDAFSREMLVSVEATGGTVTEATIGNVRYRIHTFLSNGTFTVSREGYPGTVEYFIVAGGGGGGTDGGGGGGAGGHLSGTFSVLPQSYAVVRGNGGAVNANGGNSSVFGFTAIGGGRGGSGTTPGGNGGSGGGGTIYDTNIGPGANVAGQGSFGGTGSWGSAWRNTSYAGGGGFARSGTQGQINRNGGEGFYSNFDGTNKPYCGGGGGAGEVNRPRGNGWPSNLSGGRGSNRNGTDSLPGVNNTGGGGGGGGGGGVARPGGTGIVMIRYPLEN